MGLWRETCLWWKDRTSRQPAFATLKQLGGILLEFASESTPAKRRQRYGDVEFDWDHRVDTTGATVNWRDRFIGHLHSAYQPTDPAMFHEMVSALGIDCSQFSFIDIGSGKGRVLLMASQYPFRRVVGVELLSSLHRTALQNIADFSEGRRCPEVQSVNQNAVEYDFPGGPLVIYLFNPLGEVDLMKVVDRLNSSLMRSPRQAYVIYHNALLGHVLLDAGWRKLRGELSFSLYSFG